MAILTQNPKSDKSHSEMFHDINILDGKKYKWDSGKKTFTKSQIASAFDYVFDHASDDCRKTDGKPFSRRVGVEGNIKSAISIYMMSKAQYDLTGQNTEVSGSGMCAVDILALLIVCTS